MQLLLVRHCQSAGSAPDAMLTQSGARAARALAARLTALGVDALYSSPYARALATLGPYAQVTRLPINEDARLRERNGAALQDRDAWLAHTARAIAEPLYAQVGEESFAAAAARGLEALADIAARQHRLPAIASHGQLLTSLFAHFDPGFTARDWQAMRNPHLFLVTWVNGRIVSRHDLR